MTMVIAYLSLFMLFLGAYRIQRTKHKAEIYSKDIRIQSLEITVENLIQEKDSLKKKSKLKDETIGFLNNEVAKCHGRNQLSYVTVGL